jgi:three-Cys-motif partner protein
MIYSKNEYCSSCPQDKMKDDGDCTRANPDGFVVRCGPPWTIEKHWYVEGYCEIISKAMPRKFPNMSFIDLFSGPGLYYHRLSGIVFHGSHLIATKYRFKNYILNDMNEKNIEALKYRLSGSPNNITYFQSDANDLADNINQLLSPDSLNFCLTDPDNMRQLQFKTLQKLASGKRIDLLINFPYGNSFKRGAMNAFKSKKRDTAFDLYFNTEEWRHIFSKFGKRFSAEMAVEILRMYLEQFYKIGYAKPEPPYDKNYIEIRNSQNREIYFLVFLSKHQLGYKFWHDIVDYTKGRNLNLNL